MELFSFVRLFFNETDSCRILRDRISYFIFIFNVYVILYDLILYWNTIICSFFLAIDLIINGLLLSMGLLKILIAKQCF